jgi:hypothetical protein
MSGHGGDARLGEESGDAVPSVTAQVGRRHTECKCELAVGAAGGGPPALGAGTICGVRSTVSGLGRYSQQPKERSGEVLPDPWSGSVFTVCGCKPPRPNVELSGRQRYDARPWLARMYCVPPARAWRHAVGAPLERKVRRSPDEATEAGTPQVAQTASLPANKEGGGSLVQKLARVVCLD